MAQTPMPRRQTKLGFASPYYGKLKTASLPSEVKAIWYSRNDEPPECPRHGWSWEQVTEPDHESLDLALKILAVTPLTEREVVAIRLMVFEGCTLEEAGREMDCTRSRVQQIVNKGIRRLRIWQQTVTGIKPDDLYCEVTTWRGWTWANRSIRR